MVSLFQKILSGEYDFPTEIVLAKKIVLLITSEMCLGLTKDLGRSSL